MYLFLIKRKPQNKIYARNKPIVIFFFILISSLAVFIRTFLVNRMCLVVCLIFTAIPSPLMFFLWLMALFLLSLSPLLLFLLLLTFLHVDRPVLFVLDEAFGGVKNIAPAPRVILREPQLIILERAKPINCRPKAQNSKGFQYTLLAWS